MGTHPALFPMFTRRMQITLARTFSKEAGLTSEKQMRNTSCGDKSISYRAGCMFLYMLTVKDATSCSFKPSHPSPNQIMTDPSLFLTHQCYLLCSQNTRFHKKEIYHIDLCQIDCKCKLKFIFEGGSGLGRG